MDIVRQIPDDSERVAAHGFKVCNAREKRLCELYMQYPGDPRHASREAGYLSGTLAPLKRPHVAAYLELLQNALAEKSRLTSEKVIKEISALAFSNMLDAMRVDADGVPQLDLRHMTREQWATVTEYTEDATGGSNDGERRLVLRRRIKMASKIQALELLGKHLKLFTEKVEHSISDELAAVLNEGRARVKTLEQAPEQLTEGAK